MQQDKMNKNAENFRKITMKVLVMQLASTTIMDLVCKQNQSGPPIYPHTNKKQNKWRNHCKKELRQIN